MAQHEWQGLLAVGRAESLVGGVRLRFRQGVEQGPVDGLKRRRLEVVLLRKGRIDADYVALPGDAIAEDRRYFISEGEARNREDDHYEEDRVGNQLLDGVCHEERDTPPGKDHEIGTSALFQKAYIQPLVSRW